MNDTNMKNAKHEGLLPGILIGILIAAICFGGYLKYRAVMRENHYLIGGWVLCPPASDNPLSDQPVSFDFHDKTVYITTPGGEYTCEYAISKDRYGSYTVTIYDYPGIGDVVFTSVTQQPLVHMNGSGTVLDGIYLYAG